MKSDHNNLTQRSAMRMPVLIVSTLLFMVTLMPLGVADESSVWFQTERIVSLNDEPVKTSFCLIWVDPICGNSEADFGAAIDLDANTMVVGNPNHNQVHIYERVGMAWIETATLTGEGRFGTAVVIEGETIVVGAPGASEATILTRDGGQWVQEATFSGDGCLGWGVTVSEGRVGLGDSCVDRIHVLEQIDDHWTETAILEVDGAEALGHFLDSSESRIAAASRLGVLVFELTDNGWEVTQATQDSPKAVGIDGDTLVVSVFGLATVYRWDGEIWLQTAELRPQDASPFEVFDRFGRALGIEGDTIVVGAPRGDASPGLLHVDPHGPPPCISDAGVKICIPPHPGAAYVFERGENGWEQQAKIVGDQTGDGRFGSSVSLHPDERTLAVGAPFKLASGFAGSVDVDPENSVHLFSRGEE